MREGNEVRLGPGARSYGSYIGGRSVPGDDWVYVVDAAALLDDAFSNLTLKRRLERGQAPDGELPPSIVGRVAKAGPDEVRLALEAASRAAVEWAAVPLEVRLDRVCTLLHRRITERAEEIEEILVQEGHPRVLARWQVSGMLECWGPESVGFYHSQLHQEFRHGVREISVRRRPDGVVCLNPPQNAPMSSALLGVHAIFAGNALVVRAPRSGPLGVMYALQELVAPVLDEVGAPPGTLGVVCGDPAPLLNAWLDSPLVDDIMYFGSSEAGIRFQDRCVTAGKKPILELAGNDVVTVWKDADVELAAEALTEGFFGSGQLCMIPNQVVVHPDVAERLLAELVRQARLVKPGRAGDEDVLLTPVLRNEKFFDCLDDALLQGAELVCGGHAMLVDGTRDPAGIFLEPTVVLVRGLTDARRMTAVSQETFFPLLPVIVAEPDDDERLLEKFIDFVNSTGYGLRNSLWAADREVVDRFVDRVTEGGLLKVNDSHIGFLPYLPSHGGTGLTGGVFGEANYPALRTTHVQGVSVSPGGIRPRDAVFGTGDRPAA
ncbi:aldehyde dehydrogenase family protein [Streptomyces dioscori]|uniref:aldehyde dehydrogenase family protein n=1 Tax=Streptomyces dioscori TaxID=2109333 RepID=UPI0018FE80AE|nr:aldehyde dehydrogenase [Streptomyces dioscori]